MPRQHPLGGTIPGSNSFDLSSLRDSGRQADACQALYEEGFIGAFDAGEHADEGWTKRIADYDRDEFMHDTPGPKRFSEIFDSLSSPTYGDEEEGMHVKAGKAAFAAFERDAKHKGDDTPFSIQQNFGICVDSSNVEMKTGFLGLRAMDPNIQEAMHYLAAHYQYAERGYCGHGWTMGACATQNKRWGWCPATVLSCCGEDWRTENAHEYKVARDWCRSGLPDALTVWVKEQGYLWEDSAITRMDGGLDALRRLFENDGAWHHGSNATSGGGRPDQWTRIGGHAQTSWGGDWSEKTVKFFADKGFRLSKSNDFWIVSHQTWANRTNQWGGETDDQYWPEWWGPKPPGAWVSRASSMLSRVSGYAYLPSGITGVEGGEPPKPPTPPVPEVPPELLGNLRAKVQGDIVVVNGTVIVDYDSFKGPVEYLVVPDAYGSSGFRLVPKPVF